MKQVICGTGEEKVKKRKKHRKHALGKEGDRTVHKNKYGFVEIENPVYYNNNYYYSPPQFLMRKATPEERREMVVNYIIRRDGKPIDLNKLADKLAVSKRTLQFLMKSLKDEGLIEVQPTFDKLGNQWHNSYRYIDRSAGRKIWFWFGDVQILQVKISLILVAEILPFPITKKSYRRKTRGKYLKRFKKDESACIRNPKYHAIRYSHFISQKDGKATPVNYIRINFKTR